MTVEVVTNSFEYSYVRPTDAQRFIGPSILILLCAKGGFCSAPNMAGAGQLLVYHTSTPNFTKSCQNVLGCVGLDRLDAVIGHRSFRVFARRLRAFFGPRHAFRKARSATPSTTAVFLLLLVFFIFQ